MFELPNAKRVRRADLARSRSSSPQSQSDNHTDSAHDADESTTATLLARLNATSQFTFDAAPPTSSRIQPVPDADEREDADDTFAFNLFSASNTTDRPNNAGHVRLDSPPPDQPPGLRAPRPASAYTFSPSASLQAEFAASAVEGTSILAAANRPQPGLQHKWRVTHLPLASGTATYGPHELKLTLSDALRSHLLSTYRQAPNENPAGQRRKGRPGKKARLKRRVAHRKDAHAAAQLASAQAKAKEKEDAQREKKRALNRKKQHRKREKKRLAGEEDGDSSRSMMQNDE